MRRGFSLLELLVVLAVLGVLLGIGTVGLARFRAQAELDGAARSLAWALSQARAEVKRTGTEQVVTVTQDGFSYGSKRVVLQGVRLSGSPGLPLEVRFYPPYGTTDAPVKKIVLTEERFGLSRSVHVVGVIGKVVLR